MKKLIAALLAAAVLFSFAACRKTEDNTESTEPYTLLFEEESEAQSAAVTTSEKSETTAETTTKSVTEKTTAEHTTKAPATVPVTEKKTERTAATTAKKSDSVMFSIDCTEILGNMENLKTGKEYFVPKNGVIFSGKEIDIKDGDTVFDVLKRVCNDNNIQLEYSYSGGFGTYYIEGINQLYEKDCGRFSGWLYSVNGETPSVGCSSYKLKNGDSVKVFFTCDLDGEF